MTLKITSEVLEAHLNCTLKAHLKLGGQRGEKSEYEAMLAERRDEARLESLDKILRQQPMDQVERGITLAPAKLKRQPAFILDAVFEDDSFLLHFDGLKKVDGPSKLGAFHYVPMLFHESRHVSKQQKLLLAIYGILLAPLQGRKPDFGIVWHGKECQARKVLLKAHFQDAKRLLDSLHELQIGESEPTLVINDHCPLCEFRQRCHSLATSEDNLSLVRGIGAKEIKKYARKGILTVSQLSHTFRPRRKGKRAEPGGQKRHHSLQAMAVRDKTIYVLGSPVLRTSRVQIYFDIEADPEEGFVYLVGMIVVENGVEKRFSFWADGKEDEQVILQQFLTALPQHDDFVLHSYGGYERAFLKRMQKQSELNPQLERAIKASANVLAVIYAHVYFPTYSNSLKEIATCLGFCWTEPAASGLQSIVWRAKWETTHDDDWKQKLLRYNLEDCAALKLVADQVHALATEGGSTGTPSVLGPGRFRVSNVQEMDKQARIRKWGTVTFVHPDYAYVNGCAYFSYQRQKVYVQTNRTLRKNRPQSNHDRNRRLKVTRRVQVLASECEHCKSTDVVTINGPPASKRGPRLRRAFDLLVSTSGIRLSVIECRSKLHQCRTCGTVFVPRSYYRLSRYFHGLKSWAMYQHVAHGLSFGTIKQMIDVFFGLPIEKSELHKFKAEMAWYYEETCRCLWGKLLAGNLLHVDETQIRLKGGKIAYVWAFTNLEEVVYVFRPNREGEFLRDLLKGFQGVLVSDFYTAYDSIDCPQQKCLIHLIRDMNDELLANPFDEELQAITMPFGSLLRPIVAKIGELGLRKWHLRRFKKDVTAYFRLVESLSPRSDVAQALRDRLLKCRNKLFTFLDHDGIPWNNNNAENAIKHFALYRAHVSGMMRESGVANFLTLLSVCQTCKYKGINFWKFLASRRQFIDGFAESKCRGGQSSALDMHPDGLPLAWDKFRQTKEPLEKGS